MLAEKVEKAGAKVYLVNTGWNGTGQRMKLRYTRAMVTAALTGAIEKADFVTDPTFGVQVPTAIEGVPSELLIPENTWADKEAYRAACRKLASSFVENFKKYTRMSAEVVAAGPKAECAMIELKILLDEVDYRSLSEVLIPALAESMAKDGGVLGGMLSQNKELAASMARTVLDKMPQEKKDELLVQLLNRNRDKLLEKGRTLAAEKGVHLQLCDVSARKF